MQYIIENSDLLLHTPLVSATLFPFFHPPRPPPSPLLLPPSFTLPPPIPPLLPQSHPTPPLSSLSSPLPTPSHLPSHSLPTSVLLLSHLIPPPPPPFSFHLIPSPSSPLSHPPPLFPFHLLSFSLPFLFLFLFPLSFALYPPSFTLLSPPSSFRFLYHSMNFLCSRPWKDLKPKRRYLCMSVFIQIPSRKNFWPSNWRRANCMLLLSKKFFKN